MHGHFVGGGSMRIYMLERNRCLSSLELRYLNTHEFVDIKRYKVTGYDGWMEEPGPGSKRLVLIIVCVE